jgi:hypothetical protein
VEAGEQQIGYEVARAGRDFLLFGRTASNCITNPVLYMRYGKWSELVCQTKKIRAVFADVLYSFIILFQDSEIENDICVYQKRIYLLFWDALTCRESPTAVRNKRNPNFLMTKHEHSNKRRKESTL